MQLVDQLSLIYCKYFADLLQLVETTCSKPVNNKFSKSMRSKSVIDNENVKQDYVENIRLIQMALTFVTRLLFHLIFI